VDTGTNSVPGDSWIDSYVQSVGNRAFQFAAAMLKDPDLAEEIVQEAFVRAWLSPRTPRDMPGFERWLFRSIVNLIRDHQRRQGRWLGLLPRLSAPAPASSPAAGDPAMRRALDRLSPREREAVYLRFFSDLAYQEVGVTMGLRESTARVLVHRAMDKLRRYLANRRGEVGTT
jgi:RNA polymerase sigma-70 factor (ECF subfamily)